MLSLALGVDLQAAGVQSTTLAAPVTDSVEEPGLLTQALFSIVDQQRKFHRKLTAALNQVQQDGAVVAWTLIATSFLYGVFHAAGPGHGKAVLTAYLVTHPHRIARGVMLAAASAGVQGLTAIIIVLGLVELAGWATRDSQIAVRWAEQMSFALVSVLGAYLLFRAFFALKRMLRPGTDAEPAHNGHDASCGHSHVPIPDQTEARDLRTTLGVILSIGLRPCSGAVLVLAVANIFGIPWAGIAAVAAMSVGTAIAVASLALLVVSARRWVSTLLTKDGSGIAMAGQTIALFGGAIIMILGLYLLAGSFGTTHPLGL